MPDSTVTEQNIMEPAAEKVVFFRTTCRNCKENIAVDESIKMHYNKNTGYGFVKCPKCGGLIKVNIKKIFGRK